MLRVFIDFDSKDDYMMYEELPHIIMREMERTRSEV